MISRGVFSSARDDWKTPRWLFDKLNTEFQFTVDLCADDNNHLCEKYYTRKNDGLRADLTGERVFCNPPYGREVSKWVKKCAEANALSVMLLAARTDTKMFHEYIYNKPNVEVRFLQGRLYFDDDRGRAPFPSMVVIFRRAEEGGAT